MSNIKSLKILTINDSFLLRGINTKDIMENYHKGKYKNLKLPDSKIEISESFKKSERQVGESYDSEFYNFNDKIGTNRLIVTTNHPQFNWYKNDGTPPFTKCLWCRNEIKGKPIGIPVRLEKDEKQNKIIYYVEDCFCSFECCLTQLRIFNNYKLEYKDPIYKNSEQMLYSMYSQMHPNEETIRIRPDWRLLNINGGPLSEKDYYSNKHKYVDIKSMVLIPAKRKYIKLNIKSK